MSVKVAVRCRPFNDREKALGCECVVSMKDNSTVLYLPGGSGAKRHFTYDHSFWSFSKKDPNFATQEEVFKNIGASVLDDAFAGYNSCVFAYGQTGAGKSYSMMGGNSETERGIIPRLCEGLFSKIDAKQSSTWTAKIEVSYMEIYLERVRDLLNPAADHNLRVREHTSTGPYVEGLTRHAVTGFDTISRLMQDGNRVRTVKATAMNDVSSRSHAIFQLIFTQTELTKRGDKNVKLERVSRISLVDLAGSERSGQINSTDSARLKEGNKINQSLSTLGKVISVLAEQTTRGKKVHVPYRESVLTWLLRESLGGNSKTIMLAAVSPAEANYEETLSTLRYASQAKRIVNKAVVNEDATATMVRKLNEEIQDLRQQLAQAKAAQGPVSVSGEFMSVDEVSEALEESERLMGELTESWEHKLENTVKMQQTRQEQLAEMGIDETSEGIVGVRAPKSTPFLINLSAAAIQDGECLVYYLREGVTVVVRRGLDLEVDDDEEDKIFFLELNGIDEDELCEFHCVTVQGQLVVSLNPLDDARILVNDKSIASAIRLKSGDHVKLSETLVFQFHHPCDIKSSSDSSRSLTPLDQASSDSSIFPDMSAAGVAAPKRMLPISPSSTSTPGTAKSSSHRRTFPNSPSTPRKLPSLSSSPKRRNRASVDDQENRLQDSLLSIESSRDTIAVARELAFLEYSPDLEDRYLALLIPAIDHLEMAFKLLPAYGLYLMLRHCQSSNPSHLVELLNKISTLLDVMMMSVCESEDPSLIIFWVSNLAEFVNALQLDTSMAVEATTTRILLMKCVQDCFNRLVEIVRARLTPHLSAIITETNDILISSAGFTKPQPAPPSPLKKKKSFWSFSSSSSTSIAEPEDPWPNAKMSSLIDTLEVLHFLCQQSLMPNALVQQLYHSIFYFIGAATFNRLIQGPSSWYTSLHGVGISYNIAQLLSWTATHEFKGLGKHLDHLSQLGKFFLLKKDAISQIDSICECCSNLNSLQFSTLFEKYTSQNPTDTIPVELKASVQGRAMNQHDPICLEDETLSGTLTLLRNENFALPFRLRGDSHMGHGLLSLEMIVYVQDMVISLLHKHANSTPLSEDTDLDQNSATCGSEVSIETDNSQTSILSQLSLSSQCDEVVAWAQVTHYVRYDPALPDSIQYRFSFFTDI